MSCNWIWSLQSQCKNAQNSKGNKSNLTFVGYTRELCNGPNSSTSDSYVIGGKQIAKVPSLPLQIFSNIWRWECSICNIYAIKLLLSFHRTWKMLFAAFRRLMFRCKVEHWIALHSWDHARSSAKRLEIWQLKAHVQVCQCIASMHFNLPV